MPFISIKNDLIRTYANRETREAQVDFKFSNSFMTMTSFDVRVTSNNNFIEVSPIESEITFIYDYDSDGKLIRFWGKSGLTLDFEYDCD